MVLAERNSELVRNGRRSRGPSPNNGHGATSAASGGVGSGGGGLANTIGAGNVGISGTGTPETSSDDDNSIKRNGKSKTKQSDYEEKIRVGRDYQAVCPALIPEPDRKPEILNDRALLVWSPTKDIPDSKLEEYISVAKEKYGYNGEQALGMLFWHKHDLERAVMDLANFTPFPDEWTVEDKVLFEQAFQFHGKSFHRIRQMLPDKSIASLVKYYYSWKKTRHRQSVMDRQEKAKASKEGSDNGSENGSNEESDNDDKDQALALGSQDQTKLIGIASDSSLSKQSKTGGGDIATTSDAVDSENVTSNSTNTVGTKQQLQQQRQQTPPINVNTDSSSNGGGGAAGTSGAGTSGTGGCCSNCGVACNHLHTSPHGKLCSSCHHHWRRTGNKRPTSGPYFGKRSRDRNADRHKRKPPRGMYINHDDIIALASSNNNQDELLANIDREIVSLLSQVQQNKQTISALKRKTSENIEDLRPPEIVNRINSRWTNEELLLAVQGVRKFGKDFQTIAETIGTKTEAHVRTFYVNHRRRYNLDQMIKKHEAEKEAAAAAAASNNATTAGSETIANTTNIGSNKKDEAKKKDSTGNTSAAATATAAAADESDNTTSSETTVSKSTNEEVKSTSSSANVHKDNIIMEIDLDADQVEVSPLPTTTITTTTATTATTLSQPAAKKFALALPNQELPKESAV